EKVIDGYTFEHFGDMSDADICHTAIGFTNQITNQECQELCTTYVTDHGSLDGFLTGETLENCFFQHYEGSTYDVCFQDASTWHPDHLEEGNRVWTKLGETVYPSECQGLCQKKGTGCIGS